MVQVSCAFYFWHIEMRRYHNGKVVISHSLFLNVAWLPRAERIGCEVGAVINLGSKLTEER